jgi:hypothetical protein
MRNRSNSVKRKIDDTISYANVVSNPAPGGISIVLSSEKIETMTTNIATVTSLNEKMDSVLETAPDSDFKTVLMDMSKAIRLLNENHSEIVKAQKPDEKNAGMTTLGTIPKRNRVLSQAAAFESGYATQKQPTAFDPPPPLRLRLRSVRKWQDFVMLSLRLKTRRWFSTLIWVVFRS